MLKKTEAAKVSEFEIITVDAVAQPSAPGAYPTPIYEHLLNSRGGYQAMNMARELHGDEKGTEILKGIVGEYNQRSPLTRRK